MKITRKEHIERLISAKTSYRDQLESRYNDMQEEIKSLRRKRYSY